MAPNNSGGLTRFWTGKCFVKYKNSSPLALSAHISTIAISMDFATSAPPLGPVRFEGDTGQPLPPNSLVYKEGATTLYPNDAFAPKRLSIGIILPFWGPQAFKGFSLGLMPQSHSSPIAILARLDTGGEASYTAVWIVCVNLQRYNTKSSHDELSQVNRLQLLLSQGLVKRGSLRLGQQEFLLTTRRSRHPGTGLPT